MISPRHVLTGSLSPVVCERTIETTVYKLCIYSIQFSEIMLKRERVPLIDDEFQPFVWLLQQNHRQSAENLKLFLMQIRVFLLQI